MLSMEKSTPIKKKNEQFCLTRLQNNHFQNTGMTRKISNLEYDLSFSSK